MTLLARQTGKKQSESVPWNKVFCMLENFPAEQLGQGCIVHWGLGGGLPGVVSPARPTGFGCSGSASCIV